MASFLLARLRLRPLALLAYGLVPLAASAGCGSTFQPPDGGDADDAATGGSTLGSGGATADGGSSGGRATGGDDASGGRMATDAPELTGGTSAGGSSGAGGQNDHTGPCYDEPCEGSCEGSCDDGFTCDEEAIVACAAVVTTVCGCDGVTFQLPSACPTLGYDHSGACEPSDPSYDCNPDHITCLPIVAPEPCPSGEVYSVESSCYGSCVPIGQCACASHADCPDPNGTDEFACHGTTDRCGPWL
jgi:hypothetical protein